MPSFPRFSTHRFFMVLFALLFAGYAAFEAYDLWIGPRIIIRTPADRALVTDTFITVEGETRNVTWISFLDRPITINEQGEFREKLLLPSGYSILTLEARDRLGRVTRESVEVVRKENHTEFDVLTPRPEHTGQQELEATSTPISSNQSS